MLTKFCKVYYTLIESNAYVCTNMYIQMLAQKLYVSKADTGMLKGRFKELVCVMREKKNLLGERKHSRRAISQFSS